MSTKIKTLGQTLRSVKRKDADELAELLAGDLSETKAACEAVAGALDDIDTELLEGLAEHLDQLPATAELADAWRDAVAGLNMVLVEVGEADVFRAFVEAYDAAEEALFVFIDLRDADTYPGIGDERAGAWDEAVAAFDELADQWDQVDVFEIQHAVTSPE